MASSSPLDLRAGSTIVGDCLLGTLETCMCDYCTQMEATTRQSTTAGKATSTEAHKGTLETDGTWMDHCCALRVQLWAALLYGLDKTVCTSAGNTDKGSKKLPKVRVTDHDRSKHRAHGRFHIVQHSVFEWSLENCGPKAQRKREACRPGSQRKWFAGQGVHFLLLQHVLHTLLLLLLPSGHGKTHCLALNFACNQANNWQPDRSSTPLHNGEAPPFCFPASEQLALARQIGRV
mmetsp:Transcript_7457/g.45833  ORF Transcript_7457/g.45833 Transcript_7457/m.45833 type:complete len:234 (+) Transcript_7457:585-1286(+)